MFWCTCYYYQNGDSSKVSMKRSISMRYRFRVLRNSTIFHLNYQNNFIWILTHFQLHKWIRIMISILLNCLDISEETSIIIMICIVYRNNLMDKFPSNDFSHNFGNPYCHLYFHLLLTRRIATKTANAPGLWMSA